MIKITKDTYYVYVELPITTLTFDRTQFDLISDHIYFLTRKSSISNEIIRQKGNIEELNMGHWLCIKNKYQTKFNDHTLKSLDVEYLISQYII
jgi:hypothetical protein